MKKKYFSGFLLLALFFSNCTKKSDVTNPSVPANATLTVKLSHPAIYADGFDETTIAVLDKNGNDVTAQAVLKINGVVTGSTKFSTSTQGSVKISASIGTEIAPEVTLIVSSAGISKYSGKVLLEKYTAAWCGFCPRVSYKVKQTVSANPKVIPVYLHDGDALNFPLVNQLKTLFNINAVPGVVLNRKQPWMDNVNDWNELVTPATALTSNWAPLGQSIQTSINGNVISGKVLTEFNVSTSRPLKIMIMLVEDGVVVSQSNYYNTTPGSPLSGLGQPITGYVQQNVLRQMATDILGDPIPATATVKNAIYEKSFSFNAAGLDISKCSVVSSVVYDHQSGWQGSLNSQVVKAGLVQLFD